MKVNSTNTKEKQTVLEQIIHGDSQSKIADDFGIRKSTVSDIKKKS